MAKKNEAAVLVRGLGMAMSFLEMLTEEIVEAGGFEEMIHFTSKERDRPLVKQIAQQIVQSDWQIPRSLVERLTAKWCINAYNDPDPGEVDFYTKWYWVCVLDRLGVPYVKFGDGHDELTIRTSIINNLEGKTIRYPMLIDWDGEPHVVVNVATDSEWVEGRPFRHTKPFLALYLAPAKYFDLDR